MRGRFLLGFGGLALCCSLISSIGLNEAPARAGGASFGPAFGVDARTPAVSAAKCHGCFFDYDDEPELAVDEWKDSCEAVAQSDVD